VLQEEIGKTFLKVFNMKVFVDYTVTSDPWGGINTFFKNFKKYAAEMEGVTLVNIPERAEAILFGANTRGKKARISIVDIKKYGQSKAAVVHRLDGLRHGFDTFVKETMPYVNGYVFQSKNCKEDYNFVTKPSALISNGVDANIFYPKLNFWEDNHKLKLLMVSWSTSLDKGFREFAQLSKFTEVDCTFVGRWNSSVNLENVKLVPAMGNDSLPLLYKTHDVLVFPVKRDPCSNVVIEALASGLPVMYYLLSGVEDVVGTRYGIPVARFDTHLYLQRVFDNYEKCVKNILKDISLFSMKNTVESYVKFFMSWR